MRALYCNGALYKQGKEHLKPPAVSRDSTGGSPRHPWLLFICWGGILKSSLSKEKPSGKQSEPIMQTGRRAEESAGGTTMQRVSEGRRMQFCLAFHYLVSRGVSMFWLVLRLFGGSRDYLGHGITINMLTASENEVLEWPECSQRVYKKNNPYRAWQKLLLCKGLLSPYHVCSGGYIWI